jgi:hypothetical protein
MQVAKYWRNNQLRYRLKGLTQNKIQRNIKVDTLKIRPELQTRESTVETVKVDVA